ncbi:hypothetical protein PILCRDRAFT_4470 [Piloderma croceum F 1598]|uniref:C2 domain-containing protein n=1 Tax=Piloderma croceum (strain F 1598) TaxID=765440 RepID=A0A0C3C9Z6_PILCF|nr:hypothetical protein PILCRDRAFT_4470 [Piloderma croceum F 1598]
MRTKKPVWNEEFLISTAVTSVLLLVKHDTSNPFTRNPCVGTVEIGLSTALRTCENKQHVTVQLKVVDGHKNLENGAFITFHLKTDNLIQTDAIATTNTRQHVERIGMVNAVCTTENEAVQDVDLIVSVDQQNVLLRLLAGIISKLDLLVQIADQKSKIHPCVNFTRQVTASLYKAVSGHFGRKKKLIGLVMAMEEVYSFVNAIEAVPDKLQLLPDIIFKILQQTVECVIFIREYIGHGFGGQSIFASKHW